MVSVRGVVGDGWSELTFGIEVVDAGSLEYRFVTDRPQEEFVSTGQSDRRSGASCRHQHEVPEENLVRRDSDSRSSIVAFTHERRDIGRPAGS